MLSPLSQAREYFKQNPLNERDWKLLNKYQFCQESYHVCSCYQPEEVVTSIPEIIFPLYVFVWAKNHKRDPFCFNSELDVENMNGRVCSEVFSHIDVLLEHGTLGQYNVSFYVDDDDEHSYSAGGVFCWIKKKYEQLIKAEEYFNQHPEHSEIYKKVSGYEVRFVESSNLPELNGDKYYHMENPKMINLVILFASFFCGEPIPDLEGKFYEHLMEKMRDFADSNDFSIVPMNAFSVPLGQDRSGYIYKFYPIT